MSFRKEEKLHIHKSQLGNLLNWINESGGARLYDTRIISSTYFDNDFLDMHKDSEEGSVPRKKIRIRSYTKERHTEKTSKLEIKISSVEGRYKTTNNVMNLKSIFSIGLFDKDYGVCKPKVRVQYKRSYYKIHNVRLTIDQDIEYIKVNNKGVGIYKNRETDIIVEVKSDDKVSFEYLNRCFPFNRIRFSKYSRAINSFL
jgi:SPX domain protein involved in polyphosphate accumulation